VAAGDNITVMVLDQFDDIFYYSYFAEAVIVFNIEETIRIVYTSW